MHSVLPQKERAVQKGSAINAQIQAQQGWSMPFEVKRRMNVASHGALVCTFKASGKTPQTCHAKLGLLFIYFVLLQLLDWRHSSCEKYSVTSPNP